MTKSNLYDTIRVSFRSDAKQAKERGRLKKITCLMMFLVLMALTTFSVHAAGTVLDGSEDRNIQIMPAGENEVPGGISPTTGRNLEEVKAAAPEGVEPST